jgi:hypothetical protein
MKEKRSSETAVNFNLLHVAISQKRELFSAETGLKWVTIWISSSVVNKVMNFRVP